MGPQSARSLRACCSLLGGIIGSAPQRDSYQVPTGDGKLARCTGDRTLGIFR